MRLTARLLLVVSVALPGAAAAQSSPPANVGDNANIIPIYKSSDPPAPDDYLRGNLLGQRCNEPSIAISTINRDHMMVFCNDYRATFNYDDALVPSGKPSFASAVWNGVKTFFAWITGRHRSHRGDPEEEGERIIASAEAGIGGGVSYDGGLTWQGFMVPGGPNDNTPASLAHPGKALNLQGYSDPFAVSMKDGRVGVAYIGFTRDKTTGQSTQSGIFFTVYRDRNASDVVHDWEYEFSSEVDLSQNLKQGQFLDKVSAAVGPSGTVYVAYTRFTGSAGSSNIYLAQSTDGGATWTSSAIDKNSKYGQATIALPSPADATAMGVLWRTFGSPASLVFKSTSKNAKNVDLFASDPGGPYMPFDQYSQPVNGDPTRVAFRTLAFPSAAYTPDGSRLVVVFTEWIDLATGQPGTTGTPMPMVVMKYSTDNGATWSNRYVLNWANGERGTVPASPERLGFFSPARAVGAQLMPAVACTAGNQCLVAWKQSFDSSLQPGGPENLGSYVTAGFTRRFDVRGAFVSFPTSTPSVGTSFQVSRYGYKELQGTDEPSQVTDARDPVTGDFPWAAHMELPNGTTYPIFDFGNLNHTGAGQIAFAGDYIGVKELAVPSGSSPAFMVAFSDNRYNIWPWETVISGGVTTAAPGTEWANYPYFMAPDDPENIIPGVSCVNYGSRVQSVMTARVTPSALQITAPTNHKDFTASVPVACGGSLSSTGTWVPSEQCIEFPVTVRNNTATKQTVALSLTGRASFAKRPYRPDLGETAYAYKLATGSVTIFPYSSYSTTVYAFDGNKVTVTATADTNTSTLALNDPNVVTASATAQFTYVPSTINLQSGSARSGSARSGSARSGSARSGSARSYPVPDDPVPGQTVYDVIDTTYVVTPSSQDDAGTYLSLFNIDPAYQGSYVFQVFVTKPLTSFMTDSQNGCSAFNWTEGALLGHISDPTNPLVNGSARSGSARSGSARSGSARSAIPSDGDPLVQNTSFTLGTSTDDPSLATATSSTLLTSATTASDHCRIDECTLAAPRLPNEVTILLRAYQIKPTSEIPVLYDPDGSQTGTPTPPSVAVAEYSCDDPSCTAALGPDLAVQTSPAPAPSIVPNTHVRAGGQVTYPTVTVTNQGVDGQCGTDTDPKPCGDAQTHEWAVYASTEASFQNLPRLNCAVDACSGGQVSGMVKLNADPTQGPVTVLLTFATHPGPVSVGGTETAAVGSLTIPADIPRPSNGTGTYYLHFYDDRGRVVNELDETNNSWTEGPIIVDPPGYGFLGLQTPCSGTTCSKSGTLPLAWQFTIGSTPVDSVSNLPRLKFYASCPAPVGSDAYPTGTILANSSPDPSDLTSGASGWQYFPDTGMIRPQYTWQFNFDATGLARGTCYSMYVEVPATGQVIGSTNPQLKPFGPFLVTPQ
jgi:hypothetical protein